MPLNYEGDSSAYAWCEMYKMMRPYSLMVDHYDPSGRNDLFSCCRNYSNNDDELRAAREKVIANNPGVEKYIHEWGIIPN